jgi:hypothetical protein
MYLAIWRSMYLVISPAHEDRRGRPRRRARLHQRAVVGDESLLHDGRSQSGIRQGVTLEIFGEGSSMGPLNEAS